MKTAWIIVLPLRNRTRSGLREARSAGLEARLYGSQDGRRYSAETPLDSYVFQNRLLSDTN
jgi:hypothetical protein